ncbi:MAG: orotidine-5'-phosphate decarboxylase [Thermomicrobiales bacterium]
MKLVVALDLPTPAENYELAEKLAKIPEHMLDDVLLKVGLNTYIAGGPAFLTSLSGLPFGVVLDLKLFDIPNTMASAAQRIAEHKVVKMFTVHASAGQEALQAVHAALRMVEDRPKMLAVTSLTSMSDVTCERVYDKAASGNTYNLLSEAVHGNADGVVCSPLDLKEIDGWLPSIMARQGPPPKLIRFVPGIELAPRQDDQKRKGGLKEVIEGNADYIVVGRPIYQSDNPVGAAARIINVAAEMTDLKWRYESLAKWE